MLLAAFDFLQMKVADILDILLLGIIIFLLFKWLRGTSAMSIFVAIVSLYLIRVIVGAFDMRLMVAIMDMILDVGVLAIIVIFQPEIRKFLIRLGNHTFYLIGSIFQIGHDATALGMQKIRSGSLMVRRRRHFPYHPAFLIHSRTFLYLLYPEFGEWSDVRQIEDVQKWCRR